MNIVEFKTSFENYEIDYKKYIYVVSIFLIFFLLFIIFNNNFYNYFTGKFSVINNDEISLVVNYSDLNKIINNENIIIEGTKFTYKINKINDYMYDGILFKEIVMNVDLPDNLDIINNYLDYKIELGKETIFDILIKVVKGDD